MDKNLKFVASFKIRELSKIFEIHVHFRTTDGGQNTHIKITRKRYQWADTFPHTKKNITAAKLRR